MFARLLDLLCPPRSPGGTAGVWMTGQEYERLGANPVSMNVRDCPHLDRLVAACAYGTSPVLRKAVRTWKYGRVPAMGEVFEELLCSSCEQLLCHEGSVFCPVPLHWSRLFHRGFNQAEQLSQMLSRRSGWPVRSLLTRGRSTGQQAKRSKDERKTAVRDAFRIARGAVMPTHVILLDDVATSGATLDACARVLKEAGVEYVEALVIAHG